MAEAIIGPLVGKLQELALSEARAMVAVNNDIRSLRDKLMWMQAFLRDADPRRRVVSDELMKVWLQQTRDAVFDAEDAVDQYFLQVDLSRYPSWTRTILMFFAGFTTQVRVRRNLSAKIGVINSRLEDIIKNKDKYKIDDTASTSSIVTWRASTSISVSHTKLDWPAQQLVKREDKQEELEDALHKHGNHAGVISVIGKSGVGKTTLVRDIYDRHGTKNHFDIQAWASFVPNLSASNILKLILQRLTEDDMTCPKREVNQKLQEVLKEKKYLLVIDGEVSNTEWKRILAVLPQNVGSRVVRITQDRLVDPPPSYHHDRIELDRFSESSTTELFCQRVYLEENGPKYNDNVRKRIEQVYWPDIFEITEGLPLAVVLLSGLVRTKEFPGEWIAVFEHLKSKQTKRLDSMLSLCFDDLPHDLKSCFLYFATLPANTLVKASSLVCMWMAEGFLRPKEGKTMEKIGARYLKELIARHLVNLAPMEYAAPGDERVAVQSKVHAFLQLEAQEASFVEIHSGDDIPTLTTARRLSLQNHKDKYAALANPLPKLRSILSNFEKEEVDREEETPGEEEDRNAQPFPICLQCSRKGANSKEDIKSSIRRLLQGSEFLHVINFQGLEIGEKLPSEIGNVVHLQYLGVTSCSLREIPPSIGKPTSLQTLDVRDTYVKKLPEEFWRIRTLRHVFGYNLILPRRVGHLKHLQTLETIKPDKNGWDSKTLARMIRLQALYIWKLTELDVEALSAALTKLKHLVLLTIQGKIIPSTVFTSSNLPRLEVIELDGELDLPSEPVDIKSMDIKSCLPNLLQLSLENTKVSQDFIDKLAELPFLATLTLYPDSYNGEQIVFVPGGFHSLKVLILDVPELKRIKMRHSALPELIGLEVFIYSDDLEVEIHGKSNLVEKIKKEDEALYMKIKHDIPISNCKQED